jgi:predicted TIM-barrel fold metal-dependent hydrolase
VAASSSLDAQSEAPIPIIDTHIHLFDPTRPQGVPWPPKKDKVLYHTALPARYRKLATPLGIAGAIEVECSPWADDNQWVLDVMAKDPIMVGTVGDLEPDKPDYRKRLDQLHKNRLFLGIRYGNLWGRSLGKGLSNPEFVAGLKALADAGLEMDTANPTPELLAEVLKLTDKIPNLRVVIDHLPQMNPPTEGAARREYEASLREIGKRPQIYVKISEVLRRVDGKVPMDLSFYQARLDQIFGVFGEDRVLFGSDWPNSDIWAEYPQVLNIVHEFIMKKGRAVAEKYFWKNSIAAYRWVKREPGQPQLRA